MNYANQIVINMDGSMRDFCGAALDRATTQAHEYSYKMEVSLNWEQSEELIGIVQDYEPIFNMRSEHHKDAEYIRNCYEEIASFMNLLGRSKFIICHILYENHNRYSVFCSVVYSEFV